MLAVDISNYSGMLVDGVLDRWYERGVRLIVVQAIDPPPGYPTRVDKEQAEAIVADGRFALGVYGFHWTGTSIAQRNITRFAGYGFPTYRYAGDFEDETPAAKTTRDVEIRELLDWLAALDAAHAPLAYSGMYYAEYLPINSTCMAGYEEWIANYDHQETFETVHPIAGGGPVVMKQHWGTLTFEGQPNCDLSVLSDEEADRVLTYLGQGDTIPLPPAEEEPQPAPLPRETPDDWPWPTYYEAAINYRAIADELGRQIASMKALAQPREKE